MTPTISLRSGSPDPALVAQDLRDLAALVENDGFAAAMVTQLFKRDAWPIFALAFDAREGQSREIMAEAIRRFKAVATGPVRKEYRDYGDGYFDAVVPLRALQVHLTDLRDQVCERVVTGSTTVTEEVPDPDYIAAAPTTTVTREVETVEWKCAPILADAEAVQR